MNWRENNFGSFFKFKTGLLDKSVVTPPCTIDENNAWLHALYTGIVSKNIETSCIWEDTGPKACW